jgi:hypothetical protein
MPASETETANAPTDGGSSAGAGAGSTRRRRRWKPFRRGVGYASYWIRGNGRLLTRIAAGIFALAVTWAVVLWFQGAFDRLDPCDGLVPEPTSCDPPATWLRYLQLGIAVVAAAVAVAAAVLAAKFAIIGREPRREPRLLRPLVVAYFVLLIGWLIVVILSGATTITVGAE